MIRRGLAFVPQTENVFARMSVADNLRARRRPPAARRTRPSGSREMYALFPDLGAPAPPAGRRLSGGQRQMLAVARALMVEPTRADARRALRRAVAEAGRRWSSRSSRRSAQTGVAILLVEQNARAALAHRRPRLCPGRGRNRHEGTGRELRDDPVVARALSRRSARPAAAPMNLQFVADGLLIGADDRARRHRRDPHLFDPALRQFRPWRVHRLGRLSDARPGRRDRR